MSTKTMFIVTGAAAWIGGIATAMTALSCDVEACEGDSQPSVIVRFWAQDGSAQVPVQASSVKFQVHATGGIRDQDFAPTPTELQGARCLDDACTSWMVGNDQAGRVAIYAEACGHRYTAEATVELDDLSCHAQTEYVDIQVDGRDCPVAPERIPPYECEPTAHPSVHVIVARRYDDYYATVPVEMVWFEHMGQTYEARCLQGENETCLAWVAGYDLAGPITVSTEYCDTVVSEAVKVDMLPDSCHVDTEYVMLEVSTRGCLTGEVDEGPPPRPGTPWDLTAQTEPLPPPRGPDDLVGEQRTDPPGTIDDLVDRQRHVRPPTGPTGLKNDDLSPPDPEGSLRDQE
ncbi:MAG: hypothetical protein H6712_25130 [Myxococcales bacterium]|nr:hypothetical protein [Myxococcales bacterium]MCB9717160.1 hypothetical protein [Myxococcales bacterium]